jgi:hypothetical protein
MLQLINMTPSLEGLSSMVVLFQIWYALFHVIKLRLNHFRPIWLKGYLYMQIVV